MTMQNVPRDANDRPEFTLADASIVLEVKTATGELFQIEVAHPIVDLGGQDAVVVAVAEGEVDANVTNTVSVEVQNWPADPASATNQLAANTKLDSIITKLNGGLPNALIGGLLGVQEANSTLIFTEVSQANAKLPPSLGNQTKIQSLSVTLASDQGDIPVSGTVNSSPTTMSSTAVGAIPTAQFGVIKASAGRLFALRVEHASTGTDYLQLHDAAATGGIGVGTLVGLGYALVGNGAEVVIEFPQGLSFSTGIAWALSSTKNTYTAAAGKLAYAHAEAFE